jgi:hypothetical protein
MRLGEALEQGTSLVSPNGRYEFLFQKDGNCVLFKKKDNERDSLWATDTDGRPKVINCRIEHDGRLYLLDGWGNDQVNYHKANERKGRRAYGNGIDNAGKLELRVQDDGNMACYSDDKLIWETGTTQPKDRVKPSGVSVQKKRIQSLSKI